MANGEEHPAMQVLPPQLQEMCDAIPHFGDGWLKEIYQNQYGGTITKLIPPDRLGPLVKCKFLSRITIMTTKGPADIDFEITEATTMSEAEHLWRGAAQGALREMHFKLQEQQRRVLIPGQDIPARPIPFQKKVLQ